MKKNVRSIVADSLCTSCGICRGACTKNAITFHYGKERNFPIVDNSCVECGLCYDVCPGKGLPLNEISTILFGTEKKINKDVYVGYYLYTYTGHSTDKNIRYHSASGGTVSSFLIYLLKKKIIDGAIVVRYNKDNPFEPEPFVATTEKEIWDSRSSKYVLLSMDKVVAQISQGNFNQKRLVVVGLPCQIHGWRQLAQRNKNVRDTIVGYFAIYCSVNKTKHSINYYLYRYKVNPTEVRRFSFRDDGCLGYMKFSDKRGNTIKKIPYLNYWFGTHSFFTNSRCSLCIDQLGELADISFGDIHVEPYSSDIIGVNSLITRSAYWDNLLKECCVNGYIALEDIDVETLLQSQGYVKIFKKGAGVKTNFMLRRILGKKNPVYDYASTAKITAKNILAEISKSIMRQIGHHRKLWSLIKVIDKNKD